MIRFSLTSMWGRKRRLTGTALAIVLGVAFLVGTLVLGDTLAANFDRLFTETAAGTDVIVRRATDVAEGTDAEIGQGRGTLDESAVAAVQAVDGVAHAEAEVTGYGQLLGTDGTPIGGNGPPRQAGSWVTDPGLNPYRLVEGRAPETDGEVVINRGAAISGRLAVGDRTVVQTPAPVDVTVAGIATFGDADGLGETTFTAFTLEAAQAHVLRDPSSVSSVLVAATEGTGPDELAARLDAALPDDLQAITGAALTQERLAATDFVGIIRVFLVAFALIALVVASLSISNTFTIGVAQRARELAMLRAIGASRRQVRRTITTEALAIGLGASLLGTVGGLAVAGLLEGAFDALGFSLPAGGLEIRPTAVIAGLAVGVAVTLLAAQAPARRASRLSPLAALRDSGAEATVLTRTRIVAGVVLSLAGIGLVLTGATGTVGLVGLGALVLLVGALVVAPVLAGPAASALGSILARTRGLPGRLATDNARRNPRRTASTATALVVGVAVVALFTVFASSMQGSIDDDVTAALGHADLGLTTPFFGGGQLSPTAVDEIAALPEIDRALAVGGGPAQVDGTNTLITTSDLAALGPVLAVTPSHGDLVAPGADDVAVSESFATEHGWSVGRAVDLTFPDGTTAALTVAAIYPDQRILGDLVLDRTTYAAHAPQTADRAVFVTVAPGSSLDAARAALGPAARTYSGTVEDRNQYTAAASGGLDLLLSVVYVLLTLAIVIALLGIANTLSLAIHERRQEIGLLRAVGQTRRGTRSTLRFEAVIVSLFGTVLGLALGAFLGWGLFVAVTGGDAATVPLVRLLVIALLGALAGVLAAVRPARRASRLPILTAIGAS